MKPYIRVYDRAGNYAAVVYDYREGIVQDLKRFCETGIDQIIELPSNAGGSTIMRISDVTSIVDIDESIIQRGAKQDAEEQRVFEEAKEEDEPSWK